MHLSGSITALASPFAPDGRLDMDAWARLLAMQVEAGTAAVVVAGSTGEAAALSEEEYGQLLRAAVARLGGRIPVLAGTGQSATAATIARTRLARDLGADAALVVTPPYVRPTQEGLVAHYTAVADQGGLPVVLYNVPGRTGCDMQPETVARLCRHPNIIALKEARGDEQRWNALYPLAGSDFSLLSGDDPTFVRAVLGGARGVISVASNVVPRAFAVLCTLAAEGRAEEAWALDARLRGLYDFLGVEPNPIPVKALLALQGIGHGLRLPLLPLSAAYREQARAMAEACAQLEAELA
ncbi:4-hydroxy-tetrahydrodipicolinate synthase [Arenimonas fontis]|uniref:4-hydroxy-tetrahydrodipicolinate synthase n=1 Tax=Arenimonas fontis TaxID=2608255 RepID=A0A5B2ZEE6_9GAMM|nr:4-hydroxy-tetrahydrodipicolinate synthase [Arenimonas fontis]KAA2285570.1 4-hydroxy-tetrahydrodipicolinate synthase [Arenimonas fontis]